MSTDYLLRIETRRRKFDVIVRRGRIAGYVCGKYARLKPPQGWTWMAQRRSIEALVNELRARGNIVRKLPL